MARKSEPDWSDIPHDIAYFAGSESSSKFIAPRDFVNNCPKNVQAKFSARILAVASAPPKKFSGGGYWEAMHGELTGWFELRVSGDNRDQYRFFCLIDHDAIGFDKPLIVVIAGAKKPFRKVFSANDYRDLRKLGIEYFQSNPRMLI